MSNSHQPHLHTIQTALQRDVDRRLVSERWRIVQGSLAMMMAFTVAVWPQVDSNLFIAWMSGYAVWIGITFLAHSGRLLSNWRDRYETPILVNMISASRGIWICGIALTNWPAFIQGGEFFWTLTTLWAIALSAQTIMVTVGNDYFIQAILATAIVMMAATRQWQISIGTIFFLIPAIKALDSARQVRMNEVKLRTTLTYQARYDGLTGLLNRVGIEEQFSELPPGPLAAMFVDLDRFKEVNDRLGHTMGDELLEQVGQRVLDVIQHRSHLLARLGGDEFFLVLPGCPLRDLLAIADTILHTLEQPFTLTSGQAYISASIGTATTSGDIANLEQLIRDADQAMYRAKEAGRRRVIYYDQSLRQDAQERLGLESSLRQAVAENKIVAWGQPIINYQTGTIAKVELLARWKLDQKNIPPDLFISIAANIGLTSDIARLMVNQAQKSLEKWKKIPALKETCITVNVESQDLVEGLVVDYLENLVFTEQIDPAKLILEITERGLIEAESKARFQIDRLHTLGVRVAIDDFGAGYSSLRSVMTLPVDLLKFDRSLVAGATQDQRMQNVLSAMVEMASSFKITVIGEGIEKPEDIEVMKQLKVHLLQGFYCANPMPLKEVSNFAKEFLPRD
ncbi:bifunctional diguanylate cyclase/phosphodiesterase [Acaryochloris sp. CCMEE 5410]|uniref:putative bifunctional diguanylate cyclase/phosphodiesterase n=1 Tax=Acaryochloris sp. CCMEE 5410 TaxID=310037 RepID=UPI00024848F7|nr:EAL domain-containing protein [Acaryochloris sp. CCMEE 5410]